MATKKTSPTPQSSKSATAPSAKAKNTAKEKSKAPAKTAAPAPRKTRAAKAPSAKKPGTNISIDPKPPVQEPVISHEEISLRAYFIAERRAHLGWHGDSATDWADAVAQLRAEAIEKPLKKR